MLTTKELIEMLQGVPDNVEVKITTAENGHHHLEVDNVKISIDRKSPENDEILLEG